MKKNEEEEKKKKKGGGGGGSKEVHLTTQVQLRPPTRADELPFVDARYWKSSLNSSITSRRSRRENQKHWNKPRVKSKETVGKSWTVLKVILGHKYHHNY